MNDIRQVDPAQFPCFQHATSLEVTLHAGDVLLLPSDWWHQVHTEGHSLAINYWWGGGTRRFCEPWP
jgi:ribosomal protein L16 Arg81 hydroxylase